MILSTTTAGSSSSSSSGQPVDRLTIDSSGLATFTGGITLSSTGSTLTAAGSTVLGTTGSQTLTVNAATTFASTAPITANGNVTLGASSSQVLMVPASSTFSAPVVANAAVSVSYNNTFSSLGNTVIGSNSSNTLLILATTTLVGSFGLYSNSSTAASGAVLGFQRQNGAAAVTSGFVLGSILFSGYDGSVEGSTAQIRSVFTVRQLSADNFVALQSCVCGKRQ